MDAESREYLAGLLSKPKSQLSEGECGFIKARREYLTEAQRSDYADVIGEEGAEEKKVAKKKK